MSVEDRAASRVSADIRQLTRVNIVGCDSESSPLEHLPRRPREFHAVSLIGELVGNNRAFTERFDRGHLDVDCGRLRKVSPPP